MAYPATVIPIMLASPGDVSEERRAAREVIHEWNYVHSLATGVVLLPVGWETHSAPDLGGRPQKLINERVLADCDLLVGILWTRLGTPTGVSASGTVEEIEQHRWAGKPAMIYFSSKPVAPEALDQNQYNALKEFRAWCQSHGLIATFENVEEFRSRFTQQLQILLTQNPYLCALVQAARADADTEADLPARRGIARLSDAARELLLETGNDSAGQIFKVDGTAGRFLQTNGKDLFRSDDPRDFARAQHALNELLEQGLIANRHKGMVFELTEPGFQICERMGGNRGR